MNNRRTQPGSTIIWVAVIGVVVIAMIGVALDIGYVYYVSYQLQNAADAAALAGAQKVKVDIAAARQAVIDIALANRAAGNPVELRLNEVNDPEGDIVVGYFMRDTGTFVADLAERNAVKVVARRTSESLGGPVSLFFGRMFGLDTTDLSRSAIAISSGGTGAGLIALNPHEPESLRIFGVGVLTVNDGAIQVNSDHDKAVSAGGTILIDAPEMNVGGLSRFVGGAQFDGELNLEAPPVPDPLAALPPPSWDPANDLGTVLVTNGTASFVPGFYSGGITLTGGTVTLAPGIYILDGAGLDVSGNTTFIAEGVMIYITGTGSLDLTGTGELRITPPDESCTYPGAVTYEGITIFQDRSNANTAKLVGTDLLDLDGTLYFSAAKADVAGTGDGFGNQLIADMIEVNGTGEITIMYDGRFPAPGFRSYLVR